MDRPLRIGTRGSPLALVQAHMVADALRAGHGWPEAAVEMVQWVIERFSPQVDEVLINANQICNTLEDLPNGHSV